MRINDLHSGRPFWMADQLPQGVEHGLVRLRSRVLDRLGEDGAIRELCCSRVLESALLFRLIERTHVQQPCLDKLAAFLDGRRYSVDPLDRMLANAALRKTTAGMPELVDKLVAQAPEFTSARKRVLMSAIFVILGCELDSADLDVNEFHVTGLHCWAEAQMTSVKAILASAVGRMHLVTDADRDLLLATQGTPHVWEGNILIHLSVLHALNRLPGMGQVVAEGINKVLPHQREDGGMPFVCDTDTWCSVTGGIALLASGAPHHELHRLAIHLVSQQRPGGGWAFTDSACQTDVDDISVALQFLQTLDARQYRAPIRRGIASLHAVRGADGGFPTYVSQAPSEPSMTAAVIDALTPQWDTHRQAIVDGLRFLADEQRPDGSFPPDWSNSRFHTVFRALLAARRNPQYAPEHVQRMIARSMDLVLQTQNADGGWCPQDGSPSDTISTSYSVIALCERDDPTPVARAVDYLLAHQRSDGSIESVSDSIGPRPFIFTIPALADIFALLAIGHVGHRAGLLRSPALLENSERHVYHGANGLLLAR
jgi:hypothetical protein